MTKAFRIWYIIAVALAAISMGGWFLMDLMPFIFIVCLLHLVIVFMIGLCRRYTAEPSEIKPMSKALRIWLWIATGLFALFAVATALFLISPFVFVHMGGLYWLLFASGTSLLITLTVRRCQTYMQKSDKAILSALCSLAVLFALIVTFFASVGVPHLAEIHTSPGGTNHIAIVHEGFPCVNIRVYAMVNRWIYRRASPGTWGNTLGFDGGRVEWQSEYHARVYCIESWFVGYCMCCGERFIDNTQREWQRAPIVLEFPQ